jgi:hypothetical protein
MTFEQIVQRLSQNPNVIIEGVKKFSQWRKFLTDEGFGEMEVDTFLLWNKENPEVYQSFERATLEFIAQGQRVSPMTVMDLIAADHNLAPKFTRIFMRKNQQHSGYFVTKKLKGAA